MSFIVNNPAYITSSHPTYPPSERSFNPHTMIPMYTTEPESMDGRSVNRTPSPTPSELKELKSGALDWKKLASWRFWIRKEWIWYYVALVVIVVLVALMTIYHKQIVHWLRPAADWLHDLNFGWLVPIGVLFVISFPPLFGHEIVAVLCGLVWGLGPGFGIVAAGTFLGEIGNFYAFKYCCRARGEKLEQTELSYACLAKVVRDGGFIIALIARLSAIPGHFTTAIFATSGMGVIVFSLAALLSMPKQFITVYLGVILEQSEDGGQDKTSKIISNVVLSLTVVITVWAMWYIYHRMNKVKPDIIYAKRKARQAKLNRTTSTPYSYETAASSTTAFNPARTGSDSEVPLTAQQWDKDGHAVGWTGDPQPYAAPKPLHYSHFTDRIQAFGGNQDYNELDHEEKAKNLVNENETRTKFRFGRESTNHASEASGYDSWGAERYGYDGQPRTFSPTQQQNRRQEASITSTSSVESPHLVTRPSPLSTPAPSSAPREMIQTPTQSQYATSNPNGLPVAGASSRDNDRLPSPGFSPTSPFDDPPVRGRHEAEATDATFYTAAGDSPGESAVPLPRGRVSSPPPPSYRTNIR